jgi:hypothetical protein
MLNLLKREIKEGRKSEEKESATQGTGQITEK